MPASNSAVTEIASTFRQQRSLMKDTELFLPSLTQEHTYEFLAVMYSEEHKTDEDLQTNTK